MDKFRAVAFQEYGRWHINCLERDIGASAATDEQARRHLLHVIDADREAGIELTGTPFGGIDPAPTEFHALWDACADQQPKRISSATAIVDVRTTAPPAPGKEGVG